MIFKKKKKLCWCTSGPSTIIFKRGFCTSTENKILNLTTDAKPSAARFPAGRLWVWQEVDQVSVDNQDINLLIDTNLEVAVRCSTNRKWGRADIARRDIFEKFWMVVDEEEDEGSSSHSGRGGTSLRYLKNIDWSVPKKKRKVSEISVSYRIGSKF